MSAGTPASFVSDDPSGGVFLRVKAVPGAKRDEIAGRLGDRLKIRVAAPPEGGRANQAIREMLARAMGVRTRDVEITSGHASPEKTIRIVGVSAARVEGMW